MLKNEPLYQFNYVRFEKYSEVGDYRQKERKIRNALRKCGITEFKKVYDTDLLGEEIVIFKFKEK
jgi:hypothetical protein